MKTPEKLAEEHWRFMEEFIKSLTQTVETVELNLSKLAHDKFLYTSAFIHGYKHGTANIDKETWARLKPESRP